MGLIKIGDVAQLIRGVSYVKNDASTEKRTGYIPILRANNIVNNAFQINELVYVPKRLVKDEQFIKADDILISMSSGSKTHIGKVALANKDMQCAFGAFCGKLIVNDRILSKYLYFLLTSGLFRSHIETQCKGTNINNLKKEYILGFQFALPAIQEQARIVARIEELFSQLESGVETLKQTKEQLAVYRQAVLSCAFPELTDTNKKLLVEIADITGGITKGRHLEGQDVIELPYLRVANVQDGYLDLSEMKTIQLKRSEREKYLLQYDDVLYTEGGDRDKLGRGTVWRNEIPECVHQNHIFKARINQELAIPQYVAYWSLSRDARNYFYTKGKQTVNLASINKTVLSNLPLPIPTVKEQQKIVSNIEDRLSICDQIEQTVDTALQQAEALRQSILKKAFEGGL